MEENAVGRVAAGCGDTRNPPEESGFSAELDGV
jgi:hypothetical protein